MSMEAVRPRVQSVLTAGERCLAAGQVLDLFHAAEQERLRSGRLAGLSPLARIRTAAAEALAAAPFHGKETPRAIALASEMASASTPMAAARLRTELLDTLRVEHAARFSQALRVAVERASDRAGFSRIETTPLAGGGFRIVARDTSGRALVSVGSGGATPSIRTEVIGFTDGSCAARMEAFDRALEEQGVSCGAVERRETGGARVKSVARRASARVARVGR